jgi:hypothetical protein
MMYVPASPVRCSRNRRSRLPCRRRELPIRPIKPSEGRISRKVIKLAGRIFGKSDSLYALGGTFKDYLIKSVSDSRLASCIEIAVVHRHDQKLSLSWSLLFEQDKEVSLIDPSGKRSATIASSKELEIESAVSPREEGAVSTKLIYRLGDMAFSLAPKGASERFSLTAKGPSKFRFERTRGRPWELPRPVKSYAFPDQARTYFQNASFLSDLEAAYEEQIDKIFYLGPLRDYPRRDYLWARSRPLDVGIKGEKAIDAILSATATGEQRNVKYKSHLRPFQDMIAYWLREMIHAFRVRYLIPRSSRVLNEQCDDLGGRSPVKHRHASVPSATAAPEVRRTTAAATATDPLARPLRREC